MFITNYLITESEDVTGKSQTEALPYWPSDSKVNTVGRGSRFSRKDRTVEVIKLFITWLTVWIKEKENYLSGSRQFTSGGARVYRFIHRLKPRAKLSTQSSVNFTTGKHISLREKWLSLPQRGILVDWCYNLMGDFFLLLWRNFKDKKCFKIVQTNGDRKY